MTTTHIILLNGPPRCGKDSVALALCDALVDEPLEVEHEKFSLPLKKAIHSWLGLYMNYYDFTSKLEKDKEAVIPALGVTYRQAQINMSEHHMKPLYGENVFGRLMVERIRESIGYAEDDGVDAVIVISDCGFYEESATVKEAFPDAKFTAFRIVREGCTFEGDSRSYVAFDAMGIATHTILNDGTLLEMIDKIKTELPEIFAK